MSKVLARIADGLRYRGASLTLLLVLVVAGSLRLYGIEWGLPAESHPTYSYHPDEAFHLTWAKWLVAGYPIGKHFIYGGTFYYSILNAYISFADLFAGVLGGVNRLADSILIGRYFLTAVALLTIVLLFEIGRRIFDRRVGLLAALLLAVAPSHIVWAQRVRPDEIGAFLVVLVFYLAVRVLQSPSRFPWRAIALAGVAIGVVAATRLPLAMFGVLPIVALLLRGELRQQPISTRLVAAGKAAVAIAVVAIIIYASFSPHTFIYFDYFLDGLRVTAAYESSIFLDAVGRGPGLIQYGWDMLHQSLGYPLYFLALGGVVLAFRRRTSADMLLLVAVVPYFIATTWVSWVVVRYTLPLVPFLLLLGARAFFYAWDAWLRARTLLAATMVLSVGWTVVSDLAYLRIEAGKDVRDLAAEWIGENIPKSSTIVMVRSYSGDEFFEPPVQAGYPVYAFVLSRDSQPEMLAHDDRVSYVIVSEQVYAHTERLGAEHPLPAHKALYEQLRAPPFQMVREFKLRPEFLGVDFSSSFASNDYLIVNPGIRIYRRSS